MAEIHFSHEGDDSYFLGGQLILQLNILDKIAAAYFDNVADLEFVLEKAGSFDRKELGAMVLIVPHADQIALNVGCIYRDFFGSRDVVREPTYLYPHTHLLYRARK